MARAIEHIKQTESRFVCPKLSMRAISHIAVRYQSLVSAQPFKLPQLRHLAYAAPQSINSSLNTRHLSTQNPLETTSCPPSIGGETAVMPIYEIQHSFPITRTQKDSLATAITQIHSRKFTTPKLFVQVYYTDISERDICKQLLHSPSISPLDPYPWNTSTNTFNSCLRYWRYPSYYGKSHPRPSPLRSFTKPARLG